MQKTFGKRQVHKACRNTIIACSIGLVVLGGTYFPLKKFIYTQIYDYIALVLIVIFFFFFIRAIYLIPNYKKSLSYKKMGVYAVNSAEEIDYVITQDIANETLYSKGGFVLTRNWLIWSNSFSFKIFRTTEILWAYRYTSTTFYGIIPINSNTYLMLYLLSGKKHLLTASRRRCEEALYILSDICPNAIVGFSNELSRLFRRDFSAFVLQARAYSRVNNQVHADSPNMGSGNSFREQDIPEWKLPEKD